MSSGWTLEESESGGHRILRFDRQTGEEVVVETFGPEVPREDLVVKLLQWARQGDLISWPDGTGTLIIRG